MINSGSSVLFRQFFQSHASHVVFFNRTYIDGTLKKALYVNRINSIVFKFYFMTMHHDTVLLVVFAISSIVFSAIFQCPQCTFSITVESISIIKK